MYMCVYTYIYIYTYVYSQRGATLESHDCPEVRRAHGEEEAGGKGDWRPRGWH